MKRADAQIDEAIKTIQQGGLIAYPTEAVFGLGCDFRSEAAVNKLLSIKQRPVEKGLILIASHIQHILPLIKLKNQDHLAAALKTWPGHSSWVFEKSDLVPNWISGSYKTVALRVSSHPSVKAICDKLGSAIVST
ncbi:MAG: Sua5/YciO/YrdC/YwlC family protein, partial [Proteobacteria bacterium]|nr:Sua5/YciO/YrdC/YwlC family protein [Pseudomonadota bacterium]